MKNQQGKTIRWPLLRDMLIFQLKLAADAIRDLMLSPLSIIAALIDLIATEHSKNSMFYRLMSFGRKTDQWINLFGARLPDSEINKDEQVSVDLWIAQLESMLKEQYNKGGMTSNTKDTVDHAIDNWRKQFKNAKTKWTTQPDEKPPSGE